MRALLLCTSMSIIIGPIAIATHAQKARPSHTKPLLELHDGDRIVYYGNTLLERDRHYGMIETMFRSRFPGRKLSFRNLAWPGDTVQAQLRPLNFGNMENHLRVQKPTIILVSFGNNEAYQGEQGLASYTDGYRRQLEMLKRLQARIIILSPTPHENHRSTFPDPAAHNDKVRLYHEATRRLVRQHQLTYIDLFGALTNGIRLNSLPLTDNGVHFNRYGYWELCEILAHELGLSNRWLVCLDFATRTLLHSQGTQLDQLQWKPDGLSFIANDTVLPNPAPDGVPDEVDRLSAQRCLRIRNLPPGCYELICDGKSLVRADAKQWDQGLVLISDPAYQQVRQMREAVIKKDLLFFHRWRAHNGEYIYGRRSKPGGGNAGNPTFPSEFAELDRLLQQADQHLDQLASPKPHSYMLRRVQP